MYTQGTEYGEESRKISLEITNFSHSFWTPPIFSMHVSFIFFNISL